MAATFPDRLVALRRSIQVLSTEAPMTYLDNAATTFTPNDVLEAELAFYQQCGANVRRGNHRLAAQATAAFEDARSSVAEFLNAGSAREIVFTSGATEGLNLVAAGFPLRSGERALLTTNAHHSLSLPWRTHAEVETWSVSATAPIDPSALRRSLRPGTRVFAFEHVNHVSGLVQPVAEIARVCRELGVTTVVDAAQSALHLPLDVQELGCDFLAFSGHKVLAPMGTGVLYGRGDLLNHLRPLRSGGGMVSHVGARDITYADSPDRHEAGTPNVGGALALARALHVVKAARADIEVHCGRLAERLARLCANLPCVGVLMANNPVVPIASLALDSVLTAEQVAMLLSDHHDVMVRAGAHCAHALFEGWCAPTALRVSAAPYTTIEELDGFERSLLAVLNLDK